MKFPSGLRYTKTHEWARREETRLIVGLTDYAQHEISDIVYVELPKVGQEVLQGKAIAVVESVKAAFDIYAPMSGAVRAINTALESDPSLVNREPYERGWLFEMMPSDQTEWDSLLTHDQYEAFLKQAAH